MVAQALGRPAALNLFERLERAGTEVDERAFYERLILQWMAVSLDDWSKAEISHMLDRASSKVEASSTLVFLDGVVRNRKPDSELHKLARARFREYLSNVLAAAATPGFVRDRSVMVLTQLARPFDELGPSPLLTEFDSETLSAIIGGTDLTRELDTWLYLMAETGPVPEVIPELDRRLAGNMPRAAALVLSHRGHEKALEILLAAPRSGPSNRSQDALAIARYGAAGFARLLKLVEDDALQLLCRPSGERPEGWSATEWNAWRESSHRMHMLAHLAKTEGRDLPVPLRLRLRNLLDGCLGREPLARRCPCTCARRRR